MRKIGPRLRSATGIIPTKAMASATLGRARRPSEAEVIFTRVKSRSPSEAEGGGDSIPTNILASTALDHRHHSDEGIGLGFARPGAVPELSRGGKSAMLITSLANQINRDVTSICAANYEK